VAGHPFEEQHFASWYSGDASLPLFAEHRLRFSIEFTIKIEAPGFQTRGFFTFHYKLLNYADYVPKLKKKNIKNQ